MTTRRAVWAVAGATVAAAVPWAVARIAGTDLEVTTAGVTTEIGLLLVLAAALTTSLAAWALLARVGRRVWTRVAVTVLVLSLSGPLIAEADTDAKVYLTLMHLAVAAVLIPGLRSAAGQDVRSARNTNSRPGRSGASRTSVTR